MAATEPNRSLVCIPKHSPDDTTIARLAASRSDMVTTFLHDVLVIYAHSLTGAAAKAPAETATASGAGGGAGAGAGGGAGAAEAVDGTKGVTPPPAPPAAAAAAVGTHACFGLCSLWRHQHSGSPTHAACVSDGQRARLTKSDLAPSPIVQVSNIAVLCVVAYIPCDIPLRSAVHPQFVTWLQAAAAAGLVPRYGQPMTLATASPSGVPSARVCPTPHHTTPTNSGTNTA